MSNYYLEDAECLKCRGTKILAVDDYYGKRKYGYICQSCKFEAADLIYFQKPIDKDAEIKELRERYLSLKERHGALQKRFDRVTGVHEKEWPKERVAAVHDKFFDTDREAYFYVQYLQITICGLRDKYRWRKVSEELPEPMAKVWLIGQLGFPNQGKLNNDGLSWLADDSTTYPTDDFPYWRYVDLPEDL